MFTDVVGYTRLSQANESLALELLEEHRGLLRPTFLAHGGVVLDAPEIAIRGLDSDVDQLPSLRV